MLVLGPLSSGPLSVAGYGSINNMPDGCQPCRNGADRIRARDGFRGRMGMWEAERQSLRHGLGERCALRKDGAAVSYRDVLLHWQGDEGFRTFFCSLLADAPLAGFRWETPPVTDTTVDRPFEFVLLDAPGLHRTPEPEAFATEFRERGPDRAVVAFPNLGGDAFLVVPCPTSATPSIYVHLGAFVRKAPRAQVHELWRIVGTEVEQRLTAKPLWLSTAGMGVAWLHVRLDVRPKYYGFAEYRRAE